MEEEEELELDEDAPIDDEGDDEAVIADPAQVEESFDALVAKHPEITEEEDEDPLLDMTREERLEALSIKATPKQPNEFVCSSCHLVKNQSQLADRKRELCRDCV